MELLTVIAIVAAYALMAGGSGIPHGKHKNLRNRFAFSISLAQNVNNTLPFMAKNYRASLLLLSCGRRV